MWNDNQFCPHSSGTGGPGMAGEPLWSTPGTDSGSCRVSLVGGCSTDWAFVSDSAAWNGDDLGSDRIPAVRHRNLARSIDPGFTDLVTGVDVCGTA